MKNGCDKVAVINIGKEPRKESGLPNLNALDPETLKALVLSQQAEIENLKLLVLTLKRMHFGAKSEKRNADIDQLELRLEELEANQAAADPLPAQPAVTVVAWKKPARRPLGADVSEILEYVPGRFQVIRTARLKLSCAWCARIVQEPARIGRSR